MKKLTLEEVKQRCKTIHDNEYSYDSFIKYDGIHSKMQIVCIKHGLFEQTANMHMTKKCKCPKCMKDKERITHEEYVKRAIEIHGYNYDYSLVNNHINNKIKNDIICRKHGIFKQSYNFHIDQGYGCPKCYRERQKLTTEEFIENAKKTHGDKYDYSLVKYENSKEKVEIICHEHGIFKQSPTYHANNKQGCPKCKSSRNEKRISEYLINSNIKFETHYKFDDCKYIKHLYFDFYLPEYNMCIEFDGKQHYESVEYWGGDKGLKIRNIRDKIKTEYCKKNKIKLVRISYKENLFEKLVNIL